MSKKRNRRPLDEIAADIHALQRTNLFAIGDLLIEAKEQLEHGEWLPWLEEEEFGVSSAENCMRASRLRTKFPNIGNLKLARTTIYTLTDIAAEGDTTDELMETIIAALAEVATDNRLKPADADMIIELVRLRVRFGGDYPDATLFALDRQRAAKPWREKVAEALKAKRPTTEKAADAVILDAMQEHVAELYGSALPVLAPENAEDILAGLARVPAEDRQQVLDQLRKAKQPVTMETVCAAMMRPPAPNPVPPPKAAASTEGKSDCRHCNGTGTVTVPAPIPENPKRNITVACRCIDEPPVSSTTAQPAAPTPAPTPAASAEQTADAGSVMDGEIIPPKPKPDPEGDRICADITARLAARDARLRAAFDRVVSIIPEELAAEVREAMCDPGMMDPQHIFDAAFYERYPERRPDDATEGVADGEEESGDSEKVCDHCGKPGGNEVAAGDGRQARLHRECEAAWLNVPPTVPPEAAKNTLDSLDCAAVPEVAE